MAGQTQNAQANKIIKKKHFINTDHQRYYFIIIIIIKSIIAIIADIKVNIHVIIILSYISIKIQTKGPKKSKVLNL